MTTKSGNRSFKNHNFFTPAKMLITAVLALVVIMAYSSTEAKPGKKQAERATNAVTAPSIQYVDPSETIRDLVEHHPSAEIRNDMNALVLGGELGITFEKIPTALSLIAQTVYGKNPNSGRRVLAMNFDLDTLFDKKTSRRLMELVVYHEWIHVKQQREKRYPEDLASLTKNAPTEKMTRLLFEAEIEAYTAECQLAVELKSENEFELCAAYKKDGVPGIRKGLANAFHGNPQMAPFLGFLKKF